jgi:predicted metal-binding protein
VEAAGVKTVRSDWANTVLVCRKCSKKIGGGFGPKGRTPLSKALRQELGLKKGRKGALGVVEVKCLGVCPKDAVTLVNGAKPGEWLVVRRGTDVSAVAREVQAETEVPPAHSVMPAKAGIS